MRSRYVRSIAIAAVLVAIVPALPAAAGQKSVADPNPTDPDGTTALHWAVRGGDTAAVKKLIRAGANVNAANWYGVTPLALAAMNGDAAMIAVLVDAGADTNAQRGEGETVLMTAARTGRPDAVKVLIARGAKVDATERTLQQVVQALRDAADEYDSSQDLGGAA